MRRTILEHGRVLLHAHTLDLAPLDDTSSGHLLTHEDDELERGVTRLLVDLLGAEDGLGRQVGDEMQLVGRDAGNDLGEQKNSVL